MSAVAEFVKDVGPIAIGIGGLAVAYANSRQPGREARHHARVETLYQDMLDLLEFRVETGRRAHSIGEIDPLPIPEPEAFKVTSARLQLYATPAVRAAWAKVYLMSGEFEVGPQDVGRPRMNESLEKLWRVERAIETLAERMRADLGVPKSTFWRMRGLRAGLVDWYWTRNEVRRLRRITRETSAPE